MGTVLDTIKKGKLYASDEYGNPLCETENLLCETDFQWSPGQTFNIDTFNKQIYKNKHAYKIHNKRNKVKITMKDLNNNFEMKIKRQPH